MPHAYVRETDEGDAAQALRRVLNHVVRPEITKRIADGRLPADFKLTAAQVILASETDEMLVRLNKEVKMAVKIELKDILLQSAPPGPLRFEVLLTGADSNAGHITLLQLHEDDGWYFTSDLRFNAARVAEFGDAAQQFLETAREALDRQRVRAFVDNLNSAVELMAKAYLLLRDERDALTSKSHGLISARFNRLRKEGVADASHAELHSTLAKLRGGARYLDSTFTLDPAEAERMLAVADDMYGLLVAVTPERVPENDAPPTRE